MREEFYKVFLTEDEIPHSWYNITADLKTPLDPPLDPSTKELIDPSKLKAIFPEELIKQEMTTEAFVPIPEEVLEFYKQYRPTPLIRAKRLEKILDTPAKIFYKYEGATPSGSHKLNTAIPQAYYNKKEGIKRLATETGAGQWGSALAIACNFFGLDCTVYMVKVSYNQKPYRRILMETFGAKVIPSPSELTEAGRKILAQDPNSPGSLGIAISEAVEDAATHPDTNYSLGSVLNHVILHQTIIGEEAKLQMEKIDEYPDIVIGCCGGGSNFAGISFPFLRDKLRNGRNVRAIAVEPAACPTLTKGKYTYDFGDVAGLTPLLKMYTVGSQFVPPSIHAGGLRYHGDSPIVSRLYKDGIIEARAYKQREVFEAAILFARSEGIIPAPESAHAIKAAIDEAIKAREEGVRKTILISLSGHGNFDLAAYDDYLNGRLEDIEISDEDIKKSLIKLP
ncbi:tryptophan synthase beta chain [Caldicellulosiruptor bescii]|uniref:Tryptophan synthase beta chain n=2 Tax=Caldicellulosiruptor bescii TaxID=31899 RepID=B9MLI5_CALBD|nr:TrpB-like pyridoxal phosphate-dependent enzyme [Caldicellulosiruptor bescii]ACM59193.1 pyridoxal-phosphate dependent TrpB-like enzyme [Caldicellulosiruptor bescii DSM 6725]PBC88351.1 tryptophan synthase beta chain [Caldicellulosiruptor bescii]PBC92168.1 tryptophan synthase beta chain [Caldicellulosiruptor bescii]PBD05022.1 tryptophan synthase beta chain [Caldicellulosiruptor bescii]PBD05347.1 tryptophan synthase beta chain [Caldicellulosiruptor bescii]